MSDLLDKPKAVRSGEELDAGRLKDYLAGLFPDETGELVIEQFPSGYSNLTYFIRHGEREMVLRRPPFGNRVKSAHDMGREFRVLSKLNPVFPLAPRPIAAVDDDSILGSPFYLMERRRGIILRKSPPRGMELTPEILRGLSESLIDTLADLHAVDYQAAGLGDLGKPEGYVARQVEGWIKRYEQAKTDEVADMATVADWLRAHQPPERYTSLIHNDFKFDNVMLDAADPTRIIAILDWEMATLGDPLMDLGTTLAYWVEAGDDVALQFAAFGPTMLDGCPTRQQLIDRYFTRSGRSADDIVFYFVFGLYKTAVIVQQIYYRFKQGHTSDPRFADLHLLVAKLAEIAHHALDTGKV